MFFQIFLNLLLSSIIYVPGALADTFNCVSNAHLSLPVLFRTFANNEVIFIDYYKDTHAKMQESTSLGVESEEAGELERDYNLTIDTISQMKTSNITDSSNHVLFTYMTTEPTETLGPLRFIKSTNNDLIYKCQ
jgi:hypothetical protein